MIGLLPHHPDASETGSCSVTSESTHSGFCNLPVGHGGFHVAQLSREGTFAVWDDEKILYSGGLDSEWKWEVRREVEEVVTTKVAKWVEAK